MCMFFELIEIDSLPGFGSSDKSAEQIYNCNKRIWARMNNNKKPKRLMIWPSKMKESSLVSEIRFENLYVFESAQPVRLTRLNMLKPVYLCIFFTFFFENETPKNTFGFLCHQLHTFLSKMSQLNTYPKQRARTVVAHVPSIHIFKQFWQIWVWANVLWIACKCINVAIQILTFIIESIDERSLSAITG